MPVGCSCVEASNWLAHKLRIPFNGLKTRTFRFRNLLRGRLSKWDLVCIGIISRNRVLFWWFRHFCAAYRTGVIFCFEQGKTSARRAEGRGGEREKKGHIVFALLPTRLTRTSRCLPSASVKLKKGMVKLHMFCRLVLVIVSPILKLTWNNYVI